MAFPIEALVQIPTGERMTVHRRSAPKVRLHSDHNYHKVPLLSFNLSSRGPVADITSCSTAGNGNSSWSNLFTCARQPQEPDFSSYWTCGSTFNFTLACSDSNAETYLWQHDVNDDYGPLVAVTIAQVNTSASVSPSSPSPTTRSYQSPPISSTRQADNKDCPVFHNTAVEAGIGVGVGVPILLAIAVISILYMRERTARKQLEEERRLPRDNVNYGDSRVSGMEYAQELPNNARSPGPSELAGH